MNTSESCIVDKPRDALWSHSVSWCLADALEMEISGTVWAQVAWEGHYLFSVRLRSSYARYCDQLSVCPSICPSICQTREL